MRQLKLDFGILIDKSFHVYYDEPTDGKKPIKSTKLNLLKTMRKL